MSRFTLTLIALAALTTFTTAAQAGGCSKGGYKKGYGGNYGGHYGGGNYGYKKTYHNDHYVKPVYAKPIVHEVVIEKPVIHEVIIEKPVCPAPLPSLGFFGVMCPEGMLIKEIQPNSEACRLGLAPGDVIKMFDDIRIICEDDWTHALKCSGKVACLKVIPCGQHTILEFHAQLAPGLAY
ncbi:PDZ domain-containing protein [Rubinisphaera italica]|uniref:PDZ domain-containing protein n=1 Tax=Rubinisphaera italica TaxID=2527969 RepID=A0A5C5XJB4_9PLAN|nr:signal protein PDZ [Rubinisphaera italica]TWT63277.1 hypothetical protein Pan54_40300 [Rubinisphaera italica]